MKLKIERVETFFKELSPTEIFIYHNHIYMKIKGVTLNMWDYERNYNAICLENGELQEIGETYPVYPKIATFKIKD